MGTGMGTGMGAGTGTGAGVFANILPLFRISLFLHLFEHYLFKFNEQRIIRVYDVVGDFLCGLVIIMMGSHVTVFYGINPLPIIDKS